MTGYIDRQAAIDAIERLILPQTKGETAAEEINRVAWRCAINCAEEMIGHLPSAEVEPIRHGRWVGEDGETVRLIDGVPEKSCWCSRCGDWLTGSDEYATTGHYCPNCGAHMDKRET